MQPPVAEQSASQPQGAQPLKRPSEDIIPASGDSQPKRVRIEGAGKAEGAETRQSPARQQGARPRTITFDEVYGNGNAKFKHFITEYPPYSAKFYILKCDEHGVHFNANPLAGAAKHLHSAQHGNMSKERAQAVEILGYQVIDCTKELSIINNDRFVKLLETKEYQPVNMNQASKTMRRSMGFKDTPDAAPSKVASEPPSLLPRHSRGRGGTFSGITDAKAGKLYLGYWRTDKKYYPVMILPWGNLSSAGMNGSLSETGLFDGVVPKCYRFDPITKQIAGWNPEVHEYKREFPGLYFDGALGDRTVGWVRAKDLAEFDFEDRNWKEIPYFKDARDHYAKTRGYSTYQHMIDARSDAPPSHPQKHVGVTTIARLPAPPTEDHEMADSGTAHITDNSDADSVSKGASDSDSDVEMGNTESRRTSVSNRGEAQDHNEKTIAPVQPASAITTPQSQTPVQESFSNAGQPSNQPSPGPLEAAGNESTGYTPGAGSAMTLEQTAQLAMANTSPVVGAPSSDPRIGRPKQQDQGGRRVEKIYAHNNPNRSSKSPGVHASALPDRRGDVAAAQSGAAVQQTPRVPSPASLQGQFGGQSSRPAPSHQAGYLAEPQDARGGASPLQHPLVSTEPTPGRVLEAPVPIAKARIPSPLQMPNRLASQSGQQTSAVPSPASKPDSRGSTPVMVRIDSAVIQDRWCAVRSEPASGSTSGSEPTRNSPAGSPNLQVRPSPTISVKPVPISYLKRESPALRRGSVTKELFDVGLLRDPENPDSLQIKETVRLAIDPDTQTAATQPGAATTTIVDPSKLKEIEVRGENSARIMSLLYADGQKQTLLFRPSDVGHGVQNAFIHARRFCRWVTDVSPSVSVKTSAESSRRGSESVIVVE